MILLPRSLLGNILTLTISMHNWDLIKVILETLFGISYPFGVVESQGRGTLHLHVLLWLANAPPMEEMERQLKKPEFRNHVRNFIEANIHAYVPGDHPAQTVKVTMTNCFTWNNA